MKTVKDIEHLKELASKKNIHEFSILLGGGAIRSSKDIDYEPKEDKFYIFNEIDGTTIEATSNEIEYGNITNIGRAIKCKSLIY